jgi:hypothetical protein
VGVPHSEILEAASVLVRGTLVSAAASEVPPVLLRLGINVPEAEADAMLARARLRLPALARWVEENARELLETT